MQFRSAFAAAAVFSAVGVSAARGDVFTSSTPETFRFVVNAPYTAAPGQTAITTAHTDLGFTFDGLWNPHWHQEEDDLEYAPANAFVNGQNIPATARPAGTQWDFIGTSAGSSFYVYPESQSSGLPFLGFGTEESDLKVLRSWDPDGAGARDAGLWTRVNVLSVTSPGGAPAAGSFSIYTFGNVGQLTPLVASVDGLSAADALYLEGLSHSHFNLAFSAPGIYDVTFAATTFATVPEPTALGLLGLSGLALLRRHA